MGVVKGESIHQPSFEGAFVERPTLALKIDPCEKLGKHHVQTEVPLDL